MSCFDWICHSSLALALLSFFFFFLDFFLLDLYPWSWTLDGAQQEKSLAKTPAWLTLSMELDLMDFAMLPLATPFPS